MTDRTRTFRRWIVRGAICSIAALSAVLVLLIDWKSQSVARADRRVAVYQDIRIYGSPNFVQILVNEPSDSALYVQMPDKKVYLLRDIPEHEIEEAFEEKADMRTNPNFPGNRVIYRNGFSLMTYRDDKLVLASFHFDQGFRFGRTKVGPFVRFPFGDDALLRVFGEPLSWERPGPQGPVAE